MFSANSSSAEKKVWVDWTTVSAGATPYNTKTICCSSTGSIIYVTAFSGVYKSTNFGVSWTLVHSVGQAVDICCSTDGSYVGYVVTNDKYYYSTDGGANWNVVPINETYLISCSCSGDGSKVVVASYYNPVTFDPGIMLYSTNYGASFSTSYPFTSSWQIVRVSQDGTKVFAGSANTYTYMNVGNFTSSISWSQTTSGVPIPHNIRGIACSSNGSKVVACYGSYGDLIKSSDSGASFSSAGSLYPIAYAQAVPTLAMSSDGNTFLGGIGPESGLAYSKNFFTSMDYKQFTATDDFRGGVAMKSDGSILYAANKNNSLIYISP